MKQLLLFFLILPILSFSQCPPSGIFTTQAQIDAFPIDYPNCTTYSIQVSGADITDLSGLNQITETTGLYITDNPLLQSLNGLNVNLVVDGFFSNIVVSNNASLIDISTLEFFSEGGNIVELDLEISDNPSLDNLNGFPFGLSTLVNVQINNNDALTNLEGLYNESISFSPMSLGISNNDNLIDFTGLGNFNLGYGLYISNNSSLQNLNGMIEPMSAPEFHVTNNENLTDISGYVNAFNINNETGIRIRDNPSLSVCNTQFVCDLMYWSTTYFSSWYFIEIQNNAPGCMSMIEIDYECGVPSNDNCYDAYYPYVTDFNFNLGETITANNEFATTSFELPSCNEIPNRKDLWFRYFNSGDATSMDIMIDAGYHMQIWQGIHCYDLAQLPNGCGTGILEDIPITPDTRYVFQVWNDDVTDRGGSNWFDITVQDGALSTQNFQLEAIKMFPNPVNDVLNIQSITPIENVEIFNLLGQRFKALNFGTNMNTIDMSELSNGLYIIQVRINGKESTYKVLKK